jgi:hypothetical protein
LHQHLLRHVTADIESTTNALEHWETIELLKSRVVGDLQVVADLGQHGEGEVVHLVVSDNGKGLANLSQVGQLNLDGLVVVGEVEELGNVSELHLDLADVAVVGNEKGLGLDNVDTLERANSSVLDVNRLCLLDGGGEANGLEVGQGVPLDGVDLLQLGEVDAVQAGEAVQVHLAVELLHVAGTDALDVGVGRRDEVAVQDLDSAERNVVRGTSGNGNAAREGGAAGHGRSVTGVLDGGGRRDAAGACCRRVSRQLVLGCTGRATYHRLGRRQPGPGGQSS